MKSSVCEPGLTHIVHVELEKIVRSGKSCEMSQTVSVRSHIKSTCIILKPEQ